MTEAAGKRAVKKKPEVPPELPPIYPGYEGFFGPKAALHYGGGSLGCDPEFFVKQNGVIVGSEKFLPKEGITTTGGKIVRDGVQIELNPYQSSCRQSLASNVASLFYQVSRRLEQSKDFTADFSTTVDVSPEELESLSPASRRFGCKPSYNYYDKDAAIQIDGSKYYKRSAGGHIHLAMSTSGPLGKHRAELVPVLDIILGNMCVMLDPDRGEVERRRYYGRAGEYRLPTHGLEYRTLGNFWLRSYPLASMVWGIARFCVRVLNTTYGSPQTIPYYIKGVPVPHRGVEPWNAIGELKSLVDIEKVKAAINQNDAQLAWENWESIKPFIHNHSHGGMGCDSLNSDNLVNIDFFLQSVMTGGLDQWFRNDPLYNWTEGFDHHIGWENFLARVVQPRRRAHIETGKKLNKAA